MPATAAAHASLDAFVDKLLAADAAADAADIAKIQADADARLQAALAADAIEDAKLLAEKATEITALKARVAELEAQLPDPVPEPEPEPPSGVMPNASNTGVPAGTALKVSGSISATKDGHIFEGLDIKGTVNFGTFKNCALRKSRVNAGSAWNGVSCRAGGTIEDCEIIGASGSNGIDGFGTFRRNNVHGFENVINVTGGGGLIEDNYLWGVAGGASAHFDTIQIDGSVADLIIRHNTIINEKGQTSAIMIDNYWGPIKNITVDGNDLLGGGFTIYSDGQFSGGSISGVKITNNRLKKGGYGYSLIRNNSVVWTGNVDYVTGKAI